MDAIQMKRKKYTKTPAGGKAFLGPPVKFALCGQHWRTPCRRKTPQWVVFSRGGSARARGKRSIFL